MQCTGFLEDRFRRFPYLQLVALAGRSREAFLEACPLELLVVRSLGPAEQLPVATVRLGGTAGVARAEVVSLCKRPGANPFESMFTIGRAKNNDLVLAAPDVSKFHAYIRREDPSGPLVVRDAGSTFGTEVGGHALDSHVESAALTPGSEVRIASHTLQFFTADRLLEAILEHARSRQGEVRPA